MSNWRVGLSCAVIRGELYHGCCMVNGDRLQQLRTLQAELDEQDGHWWEEPSALAVMSDAMGELELSARDFLKLSRELEQASGSGSNVAPSEQQSYIR